MGNPSLLPKILSTSCLGIYFNCKSVGLTFSFFLLDKMAPAKNRELDIFQRCCFAFNVHHKPIKANRAKQNNNCASFPGTPLLEQKTFHILKAASIYFFHVLFKVITIFIFQTVRIRFSVN